MMTGTLQLALAFSADLLHHHHHRRPLFLPWCALSKKGHRFFTSLAAAAGDSAAANRLIRKFVASSSKSDALNALSHLISSNTTHFHLSSLVLPMYRRIAETPWFNWNPKLVASVIAYLDKQGQPEEAEALISESVQKLGFQERDVALFYCDLIDSYSKQRSRIGVFESYARLKQLFSDSSSSLSRRAYETIICSLCSVDLPRDAENMVEEMTISGFKPSAFEFRSLVSGYGRLGLFTDMRRVLRKMEDAGYCLDTICSNMVLSSFGAHSELSEMASWLRKMKDSNISFSIRTYNSVMNSCPTITSLLKDLKFVPLSMEDLKGRLQKDETLLVEQLIGSSVLMDALKWCPSEGKLDLHGMHLATAYLIMLQWVQVLRSRFSAGNWVIPTEFRVICGSGKHSSVRGESPVKALVKQMMVRMKSPMKIDRNNVGCFVGRGKAVRDWLCCIHYDL